MTLSVRRTQPPPAVAAEVFGARLPLAEAYAGLLATVAVERGLLGPAEPERLWTRHLLNCAVLGELVPAAASVVDVGSGAGLPGIPLALARPDAQVVLVESLQRRATFLREVVAALGITEQVTVVHGRAEEAQVLGDVVTARAVAPLARLLGWTLPLVKPHGSLLAVKGETAAREVADAQAELRRSAARADVVQVGGSFLAEPTTVVRVTR